MPCIDELCGIHFYSKEILSRLAHEHSLTGSDGPEEFDLYSTFQFYSRNAKKKKKNLLLI